MVHAPAPPTITLVPPVPPAYSPPPAPPLMIALPLPPPITVDGLLPLMKYIVPDPTAASTGPNAKIVSLPPVSGRITSGLPLATIKSLPLPGTIGLLPVPVGVTVNVLLPNIKFAFPGAAIAAPEFGSNGSPS